MSCLESLSQYSSQEFNDLISLVRSISVRLQIQSPVDITYRSGVLVGWLSLCSPHTWRNLAIQRPTWPCQIMQTRAGQLAAILTLKCTPPPQLQHPLAASSNLFSCESSVADFMQLQSNLCFTAFSILHLSMVNHIQQSLSFQLHCVLVPPQIFISFAAASVF